MNNYAFTNEAFREDVLNAIPRFKEYINSPLFKRKEKVVASIRERGSRLGRNLTANEDMMSTDEAFLSIREALMRDK